jgi:hypothetical protein
MRPQGVFGDAASNLLCMVVAMVTSGDSPQTMNERVV